MPTTSITASTTTAFTILHLNKQALYGKIDNAARLLPLVLLWGRVLTFITFFFEIMSHTARAVTKSHRMCKPGHRLHVLPSHSATLVTAEIPVGMPLSALAPCRWPLRWRLPAPPSCGGGAATSTHLPRLCLLISVVPSGPNTVSLDGNPAGVCTTLPMLPPPLPRPALPLPLPLMATFVGVCVAESPAVLLETLLLLLLSLLPVTGGGRELDVLVVARLLPFVYLAQHEGTCPSDTSSTVQFVSESHVFILADSSFRRLPTGMRQCLGKKKDCGRHSVIHAHTHTHTRHTHKPRKELIIQKRGVSTNVIVCKYAISRGQVVSAGAETFDPTISE